VIGPQLTLQPQPGRWRPRRFSFGLRRVCEPSPGLRSLRPRANELVRPHQRQVPRPPDEL